IHTSMFPGGEIRGFLVAAEPSSLILLGSGLSGFLLMWRRKRTVLAEASARTPIPHICVPRLNTARESNHNPEHPNVILVDAAALRKAERLIQSCEPCNPAGAEIQFDTILDRIIGSDPYFGG